jgi:hypothetical protein
VTPAKSAYERRIAVGIDHATLGQVGERLVARACAARDDDEKGDERRAA